MTNNDLLKSYLTDHLAGATAGVDLAGEIADAAKGTPSAAAPGLEKRARSKRAVLESCRRDVASAALGRS